MISPSSTPSSPSSNDGLFNKFVSLCGKVIDFAGVLAILVFVLILIGLSIPDFFAKFSFSLDENQRKTIIRNLGTTFSLKVKFEEEVLNSIKKEEANTFVKSEETTKSTPVSSEQSQNNSSITTQSSESINTKTYKLTKQDAITDNIFYNCASNGWSCDFKLDQSLAFSSTYRQVNQDTFRLLTDFCKSDNVCVASFKVPKDRKKIVFEFGLPTEQKSQEVNLFIDINDINLFEGEKVKSGDLIKQTVNLPKVSNSNDILNIKYYKTNNQYPKIYFTDIEFD